MSFLFGLICRRFHPWWDLQSYSHLETQLFTIRYLGNKLAITFVKREGKGAHEPKKQTTVQSVFQFP